MDNVQGDKDNQLHLTGSTEYLGSGSQLGRGPAREGLGGQEPPLERGGECVRILGFHHRLKHPVKLY